MNSCCSSNFLNPRYLGVCSWDLNYHFHAQPFKALIKHKSHLFFISVGGNNELTRFPQILSWLQVDVVIYRSLRATALWKKWGMCVLGFLFALRLGVPEDRHVNPELTASSIWFSFYQRFLWLNLSLIEWATNLNHKMHSFLALPLIICIVLGKSLLLWACFLFSNIGIMTSAISVILRIKWDNVQG